MNDKYFTRNGKGSPGEFHDQEYNLLTTNRDRLSQHNYQVTV